MDFFGMGTGEILLILIVALIIFGPGRLPEIARQVGKTVSSLKQQSSEITSQIKKELEEAEAAAKGPSQPPEVKTSPQTSAPASIITPPPVLTGASRPETTGED